MSKCPKCDFDGVVRCDGSCEPPTPSSFAPAGNQTYAEIKAVTVGGVDYQLKQPIVVLIDRRSY